MSEQPLSDTELAELHALALVHAPAPLRAGGPTLAEYVAAGYTAETYPPAGYAAVSEETAHAEIAAEDARSMGPSGAQNIRAFLEAKQAEADAKAAAG
jgi:hypothetical protein